ncbi:hypothetical protein O2K51_12015 [Apibacter raozihei]|uniref:hypothetical protein n=1 Tax=Apibacter raozihei TaxID=2500547 RepID=UPI000FE3E257|nr:hypothetical protein [Apibacter raozihei]
MKKILFLILCLSMSFCKNMEVKEYVVPCGFEGPFVVFFNVEDGVDIPSVNGRNSFTIPSNGILFVRNKFDNDGYYVEHYRICDGIKLEVPNVGYLRYNKLFTKNDSVFNFDGVSVSTEMADNKSYKVKAFMGYIGKDTLQAAEYKMRGRANKIFDSISQIILDKRLLND